MANKSLTFSDIEIRDDGTSLIILATGTEVLKIDKTEGSVAANVFKMNNPTGAETCGTSSYTTLGGNTISSTQVATDSIIILTPHTTTPDGVFYVDSISNGVSFTVGYTGTSDPQEFYWLIINPV